MMGGSGKWLKSLTNLKKPQPTVNPEKQSGHKGGSNKEKWKLWRTSSEELGSTSRSKGAKRVYVARSEGSGSASFGDDSYTVAIATLARAPPRDFRLVKEQWAAIRIQTAFRGLLARRALRALRAVVRIQALFRGRQVRKQAAVTLKCMQALVRVQERVRARSVRMSSEGQEVQKLLEEYRNQPDTAKGAELGWCGIPGTVDEVRTKLQMRQEGAIKRERALAYSLSQQQARVCPSAARQTNKSALSVKHQRPDSSSPGWSWLDRWMATKPWDNKLIQDIHVDSSETPLSRKSEDNVTAFYSHPSNNELVKVRKNNVTTKVLAKPPAAGDVSWSYSAPSSESSNDKSSASTSSTSASSIPLPKSMLVVDKVEDSYNRTPSYMNPTESIKVKQKAFRYPSKMKLVEDRFQTKSMELSSGDTKSSAGSNPSFYPGCDLYPPVPLGRHDEIRVQRQLAARPTLTD